MHLRQLFLLVFSYAFLSIAEQSRQLADEQHSPLFKELCKNQFQDCTADEITALNDYSNDLVQDFQRTDKYSRVGEGGFVESCLEHVGAQQGSKFDEYEIAGVRMVDALNSWWTSRGAPATWSLPCELSASVPHQCNPTCGATMGGCLNDDCESNGEGVAVV